MVRNLLDEFSDDVSKAMEICSESYGDTCLHNIEVEQVEDPEIDDYSRIVLCLTVSGMSLDVLDCESIAHRRMDEELSHEAFAFINICYEWVD